jgi:hypothetical protein
MANHKSRSLRWLAPVALVGAVGLAACGDDDTTESTRTVGAAAIGSDRHLENQAAEIAERSAELDNAANTYGSDTMPNPWEAGNRAAQEALDESSSNDEFVPGTRHMPVG